MSAHPVTGLSWSRRFLPLFSLFQLGTFNDNALKNALIALITFGGVAFLSDLPSGMRVPVAAFIFTGPFLLVTAIAGQLADKIDRGVILRWIKRAEVGIMGLAALGFAVMDIRILAAALGLMGAQSAFFSPTKNAVLPQWLTEAELIRGNALLSGVQFATILAATIFGLFVLSIGPIVIAGVLVVVAVLGWLSAEQCPPAPPPQPGVRTTRRNLWWGGLQVLAICAFVGAIAYFWPNSWASFLRLIVVVAVLILLILWIGRRANGGYFVRRAEGETLHTNFDPATATFQVVAKALSHPDVLRPLLGISWFYAVSTVFVTTLPDLVGQTMGYSETALQILLAASTISILVGAMIVAVLGRLPIWGPEAVRLSALGIIGVTLATLTLVLIPQPLYRGGQEFGPVSDFLSDPATPLFIAVLCTASVFNGMFIVPLQAMAQRRADPAIRAQLMSAGSVLLNLFVNGTTFGLIGLGALALGPTVPFWIIIGGSTVVALYAVYRSIVLVEREQPGIAVASEQ